jgi:hypothetical protein
MKYMPPLRGSGNVTHVVFYRHLAPPALSWFRHLWRNYDFTNSRFADVCRWIVGQASVDE